MPFNILPIVFSLIYLGLALWVVWLVISALTRIAKGVEEMAQALRRMESKEPKSS
jgi:hypothetical protein